MNVNQLFTAQPEAPASTTAGASGWAVNENAQNATKEQPQNNIRFLRRREITTRNVSEGLSCRVLSMSP